ncbi:hypothetical protein [Rahnella selenatireducens]|uniref:hypothetical protein n=1 Tax=Rahnella selenatireducens TaxID=3389797 RepID=UPI0039684025
MINTVIESLFTAGTTVTIMVFLSKFILNHLDKRSIESFKLKTKAELDLIQKNHEYNANKNREIGRWSSTLLSAANGVIGRLSYIKTMNETDVDDYIKNSTKYYLCQLMCWSQIYKKDRDMVFMSPANDEILMSELLKNISISIRTNNFNSPVIRSLEQSYIASAMTMDGACISYANFIDNEVLKHYEPLNNLVLTLLNDKHHYLLDDIVSHAKHFKKHAEALLMSTNNN